MVLAVVAVTGAQSTEPPICRYPLDRPHAGARGHLRGIPRQQHGAVARAEQNIELLLKERPTEKANLLAWRGAPTLQRAVARTRPGKREEFTRQFQQARDDFAEAAKLATGNDGVAAITGGTLANLRATGCPRNTARRPGRRPTMPIQSCGKRREPQIEKLPVHFQGEVLAGMAQSAQRTGRAEEADAVRRQAATLLSGTPYEKTAKEWKANPATAATTNLTCKTCHNAGRLSAKLAALTK